MINAKETLADRIDLQFFGRVSASVSHDFKNALAVINENAGLLQDLVLMSEKGIPLNPERVKAVAEKVRERVSIADSMVKNFNKFTHSVDTHVIEIELIEYIELLVELSRRTASKYGTAVLFNRPQTQVMIKTSPFYLTCLCWHCLEAAMKSGENTKTISIIIETAEDGIRICFVSSKDKFNIPDTFPGNMETYLLNTLNAVYSADNNGGKIFLLFPKSINS
ncbi:Uncharacterized protein dnl_53170 [Desulfonema limicola]|uniref:Uncharacterized protein n=1 Tax=Desulfonema limicola TaxID=45656 RepID=A0A975GIX7_9BACT|nr:HAMP domain-containing histidine kinase [Desulfonema limicola]QTA82931.1 Uncharacterized protein dnl_53170 [Desulfonema limicola]